MSRFDNGRKVGKFVIERKLGQGGFGETYLAKDERLLRRVVIKCLRQDLREQLGGSDDLFNETGYVLDSGGPNM